MPVGGGDQSDGIVGRVEKLGCESLRDGVAEFGIKERECLWCSGALVAPAAAQQGIWPVEEFEEGMGFVAFGENPNTATIGIGLRLSARL